jgi:hypothetical protein
MHGSMNVKIEKLYSALYSLMPSSYLSFHVFLGVDGTMKMESRSSETLASVYNIA